MIIEDNAELKLIEKYREMIEKRSFRDGDRIGRMFSIPDPYDSDQQINVSLDLNVRSVVPKMTEMEVKVESGKQSGRAAQGAEVRQRGAISSYRGAPATDSGDRSLRDDRREADEDLISGLETENPRRGVIETLASMTIRASTGLFLLLRRPARSGVDKGEYSQELIVTQALFVVA